MGNLIKKYLKYRGLRILVRDGKEFREEDHKRDEKCRFAKMDKDAQSKEDVTDKSDESKPKKTGYKDGWEQAIRPYFHNTFKTINENTEPASLILSKRKMKRNGLTVKKLRSMKTLSGHSYEDVFFNLSSLRNEYDYEEYGEENWVDITVNTGDLDITSQFLYEFCQCRQDAIDMFGDDFKNHIAPAIKQMIAYSPEIEGEVWRGEVDIGRVELEVGNVVNFDIRSSSDDGKGFETVRGFMEGEDKNIIYYKFPKGVRGLNIQGLSGYINQHEYLIDGDFIIKSVTENEFGAKEVELDFIPENKKEVK